MREAALAALEAILKAIVGVTSVHRDMAKDKLSSASLPAILIPDVTDDIQWKTGGLVDVYLTVDLMVVFKGGAAPSTKANALDLAILAAINADPTLGGTVAHTTPQPIREKDLSRNEADSSFVRPLRLFYEAPAGGL